jgi:hypothetical protein
MNNNDDITFMLKSFRGLNEIKINQHKLINESQNGETIIRNSDNDDFYIEHSTRLSGLSGVTRMDFNEIIIRPNKTFRWSGIFGEFTWIFERESGVRLTGENIVITGDMMASLKMVVSYFQTVFQKDLNQKYNIKSNSNNEE